MGSHRGRTLSGRGDGRQVRPGPADIAAGCGSRNASRARQRTGDSSSVGPGPVRAGRAAPPGPDLEEPVLVLSFESNRGAFRVFPRVGRPLRHPLVPDAERSHRENGRRNCRACRGGRGSFLSRRKWFHGGALRSCGRRPLGVSGGRAAGRVGGRPSGARSVRWADSLRVESTDRES